MKCPRCQSPLTKAGKNWVCPKHGEISPAPQHTVTSSHHSVFHVIVEIVTTLGAAALLLDLVGLIDLGWNEPVRHTVEGSLHVEKVWSGASVFFVWVVFKITKMAEGAALVGILSRWIIVSGRQFQRRTLNVLYTLRRLAPWAIGATLLFGVISYALQSPFTPNWIPANQAKMARLATNSDYEIVRLAAVRKITDQGWLAEVAIKTWASEVKSAALENLTDQWLIYQVITDIESHSGPDDLKKLSDQTLLTKLATTHYNGSIRRAAVERLIEPRELAKIATQDEDESVRLAALKKLSDQGLLANIAVKDKSYKVSEAAAEKITNSALLKFVAENGGWEAQRVVASNLTDEFVLAKLATDVSKLTNQAILANLAMAKGYEAREVGEVAVKKLSDQQLLEKIAIEDSDFDDRVQVAAADAVSDEGVLTRIVAGSKRFDVRKAAVNKLTNQEVLARIAIEDKSDDVRLAAVKRIRDQILLEQVARQDKGWDIWRAAVERLSDQTLQKAITALKEGDYYKIPASKHGKFYRTVTVGESKLLGGTIKSIQFRGMSIPVECQIP